MDLLRVVLFASSLVLASASTKGCADDTTEGWLMSIGCRPVRGHGLDMSITPPTSVGRGGGVCSWEDHRMLRKLKWEKARSVEGCYAYNAAQDGGSCAPCANHIDQDDMAGVGKDCPFSSEDQRSCLGQGVISSSCCNDSRVNEACSYSPNITGVLCCRIPEKPPVITERFPTQLTVVPGQNWTLDCPVIGSPYPLVSWMKDGLTLHQSDRISVTRGTLLIQRVIADDAGEYSCMAANTAGYAREDVILALSDQAEIKEDIGCMDASIDGLSHLKDVVACSGSWKGHISWGKVHCAPGWRVCSHEDWRLLKAISWFDATGINGCYAYNAAVTGGMCTSCDEGSSSSMGGIGRHCSKRRRRQSSCLAEGRIDVYSPVREGGQPSCDYQEGLITGVLCCRIPTHAELTSESRKKPGRVKCKPPCLNDGVCVGRNRCECPQGYKGAVCQIPICDPPCRPGSFCQEPGRCVCERGKEAMCALRGESIAMSLAKLERKCQRHCRNGGQCDQGHCFCPTNTKGRFCQRVL